MFHRGVPLVILLVMIDTNDYIHFSHCSNHIMTRDANGYPLVSWNQNMDSWEVLYKWWFNEKIIEL